MHNDYLRKSVSVLLIALSLSFCVLPVDANSAPGKPSTITSAFAVAESTPIVVQNEVLTFKIDPITEKEATVTADYTMSNPTSETVTVNMLFPSVGNMVNSKVSIDSISTDAVKTEIINFHHSNSMKDGILMDISEIVTLYNLSKQGIYMPKHFNPTDTVDVYTVNPNTKGDIITYQPGTTFFAPDNYNCRREGNTVHLEKDKPYKIYVLKSGNLTINGTSIRSYSIMPINPHSIITMNEFALMLKSQILNSVSLDVGGMSDQEYLNQFYRRVDELINNGGVISGNELVGAAFQNLTVLCYQVSFAPGAVRDVKVSYNIAAGYPSGYPSQQKESSVYEYLLNPAKYWAAFNRLEIRVIPGPTRNNLTYSSLNLIKVNDGSYSAVFKSLPTKDLYFLLGSNRLEKWIVGVSIAVAFVLFLLVVLNWWTKKHRRID